MSQKAVFFLQKALGEDLFESLQKTELYKPDTRTVTSLEDIHLGLKLVPRAMMALLVRELVPMKVNEHKDISLPVMGGAILHVEKLGPDVYSGEVLQENKKIASFSFRPIPGVALVLMSAFELYGQEDAEAAPIEHREMDVQKIIDERIALHDLVNRVVDRKMEQKDAVQQLMLARITNAIQPAPILPVPPAQVPIEVKQEIKIEHHAEKADDKKDLPLKVFLEGRKVKLKKNEFFISLEKNDKVNCSDCGHEIFSASGFSGCVCYGENMKSKVHLKKTEGGVKISFGRGWDEENLEMLLEVLRNQRG